MSTIEIQCHLAADGAFESDIKKNTPHLSFYYAGIMGIKGNEEITMTRISYGKKIATVIFCSTLVRVIFFLMIRGICCFKILSVGGGKIKSNSKKMILCVRGLKC